MHMGKNNCYQSIRMVVVNKVLCIPSVLTTGRRKVIVFSNLGLSNHSGVAVNNYESKNQHIILP